MVGLGLHAAVGVCPFAATFGFAPVWVATVLALWWMVLAGVAVQTFRNKPVLTPAVPVIALAMWAALFSLDLSASPTQHDSEQQKSPVAAARGKHSHPLG
jgi:hypothetical protein